MSKSRCQDAAGKLLVVFIASLSFTSVGQAQEKPPREDTAVLRVGFPDKLLTEVNRNDAEAATKVWCEWVAEKAGLDAAAETSFHSDIFTLSTGFHHGELDAAILQGGHFVMLEDSTPFDAHYVASPGGKPGGEYVLLVHRDSGMSSIGHLRDKVMAISTKDRADVSMTWLDTVLLEKGFPEGEQFFHNIKEVPKSSNVVLPVFFRQIDSCLINRSAFQVMVELNPQVGRQLVPVVTSPPFLRYVVCIRRDYDSTLKQRFIDIMADLHTDPRGEQLLTIYRMQKLIRYEESHAESIRELFKRRDLLEEKPSEAEDQEAAELQALAPSDERRGPTDGG